MISDVFDKNICKVLTLFSVSPGSRFTRNDIKEKTLLHNIPLDNAIINLLNNKILLKEKRFLSLNFENRYAKNIIDIAQKEYIRLKEIPLKIYYLLMDISSELSKETAIKTIYLFGSYAKLIYTEKSDIDLAIILRKEGEKPVKEIKRIMTKIEKKYDKVIETHFFTERDMKQKDRLIKDILKNGVILF